MVFRNNVFTHNFCKLFVIHQTISVNIWLFYEAINFFITKGVAHILHIMTKFTWLYKTRLHFIKNFECVQHFSLKTIENIWMNDCMHAVFPLHSFENHYWKWFACFTDFRN